MEPPFIDEREDVQKKTFAKWINSQLIKNNKSLVEDLFLDLRNGELLLSLLEILTAQQYRRERGRMRVHYLNNVNRALEVLEQNNVKLVNICSDDIVDGNPKLTLGLVWSIILHWQVHYHLRDLMSELRQTNLEKTLLAWCRQNSRSYAGVDIKNFSTSWSDGLAFNALIHRWRPHLFDFSSIAKKHPNARLEHAFRIAQEHLGIDKLLDPEDVNTSVPDKKSIMMYVMCMFQSLPHSGEDVGDVDMSVQSDKLSPLGSPTVESSHSRPLSLATNASVELGGYGVALEEVLTWLLEAEDRLNSNPSLSDDLNKIKDHFHNHERFMLELSENQSRVGNVLEEGSRLLSEGRLSREESAEVRLQMRLLRERWEELRIRAMDHQTAVHAALVHGQQGQISKLRKWLTQTEDRISHMGSVSGGPKEVASHIAAVKALQADLDDQQPLVDSLANCVVVVDDDQQDNGVCEIEDQLRALGERWTHTCQWTETQLCKLQALQAQWKALDHTYQQLLQWINDKEVQLKQMEANPASEIGEVLERIKQLQFVKHSMDVQQQSLVSHQEITNQLIEESSTKNMDVYVDRVESLQDKFDALFLIIEIQERRIKDLGFEVNVSEYVSTDPSMDFEVTKTIMTTTTIEKTQLTKGEANKMIADDHSKSKKPRLSGNKTLEEFEVAFTDFHNWLQVMEKSMEKCKGKLESEDVKMEEKFKMVTEITNDIDSQKKDFDNVEKILKKLKFDSGNQSLSQEKDVAAVQERLIMLQKDLEYCEELTKFLNERSTFNIEKSQLEKVLDGFKKWVENAVKPTDKQEYLDQCKNMLNSLKENENKVLTVQGKSRELLSKHFPAINVSKIQQDTIKLNETWHFVFKALVNKETELIKALDTTPPTRYSEEVTYLKSKIDSLESVLLLEHAIISDKKSMQSKIKNLKDIEAGLTEAEKAHEYIKKVGGELYGRTGLDAQGERLKFELDDLNTRWTDVKIILVEKIAKLSKGIEMLEDFDKEVLNILSWLDTVDKFVEDESDIPVGDIETLEAKLVQSNGLQDDIDTVKINYTKVNATANKILENCDDILSKDMKTRTNNLNKKWKDTIGAANQHNEKLRRALEKTEKVIGQIDEFEEWLNITEKEIPNAEECNVTNSAELFQMKAKFQVLKEKCDARTEEFRNLNETGNDMILQSEGNPLTDLARKFTHLNARWTQVTDAIYERCKVIQEASLEYGELRAWLTQEKSWLDGLQRKLCKSPNDPADAEEISDELYDLENYVRNHSDDRLSRIQSVGKQLVDAHIMPEVIRTEVDIVTDRWNALNKQAAARTQLLETSVNEATKFEVSIVNIQQWIQNATSLLTDRLESDLTAQDLPEEHQRLVDGFETQKKALKDMETQIKAYQDVGKHVAASRLKEQLNLLQQSFTESQALLESFTGNGNGMEARLNRALRELRAVYRGCDLLELAGAEPEDVTGQLKHCLRFYRTLSEMKSEVETIIKSGRKMAEEKSVADPQAFSKKIDTLKELYNKLGAQITESKQMLENALIMAREIQNDLTSLNKWLDSLVGSMGQQTLELEMSRMEAIRDKLNTNYKEFAKQCEAIYLEPLKESIDKLNDRWEKLKTSGVPEPNLEDLTRFLKDMEKELEFVDSIPVNRLTEMRQELILRADYVDKIGTTQMAKKWQTMLDEIENTLPKIDENIINEEENEFLQANLELADLSHVKNPKQEYEIINVSDTIKRRLETSPTVPDVVQVTNDPKLKTTKSKIPLALRSPVPIRKEILKDGLKNVNRTPSAESLRKSSKETIEVAKSVDEGLTQPTHSIADTFNLSDDSSLFSQISGNTLVVHSPNEKISKEQTCQMVEVKESEIVKSMVIEPMEVYTSSTTETAIRFGPNSVERVEIIDTETESPPDSDSDERIDDSQEGLSEWANIQLSKLDSTVLVSSPSVSRSTSKEKDSSPEVKLEKPLMGILKRRISSDSENDMEIKLPKQTGDLGQIKVVTMQEVSFPDHRSECFDRTTATPPSTPCVDPVFNDMPMLKDLENRIMDLEAEENNPAIKDKESVAEYLILDDTLPLDVNKISQTTTTVKTVTVVKNIYMQEKSKLGGSTSVESGNLSGRSPDVKQKNVKSSGVSIGGNSAARINRKSSGLGSSLGNEEENESFYGSDKETDDALVFSDDDDEDIEVIATESDSSPQETPLSRNKVLSKDLVNTAVDADSKIPLSTSTPLKKQEEKQPDLYQMKPAHDQATVVALSPKIKTKPYAFEVTSKQPQSPAAKDEPKSPVVLSKTGIPSPLFDKKLKTPPSPLPKPTKKIPVPLSPIAKNKSHIPVSKERIATKVMVDKSPSPSSSIDSPLGQTGELKWSAPVSPIMLKDSEMKKIFGLECDEDLTEFEHEANQMMRRMDVMLLTVGGVDNERDPGKRLEILKSELGGLAPDLATLISRGDSLVYAKHKTNPAIADHLQTRYQEKLRNKWSKVMSEVEGKRSVARKAEDDVKDFNSLASDLQKWLNEIRAELQSANNYNNQSDSLKEEFKFKELDVMKMNEIAKELKKQHVGYSEKTLNDINADWVKVAEQYATIIAPSKDKEKHAKNEAIAQKGSEFVTKINKTRETVSTISRQLNSHPLNGLDFDEFPQQEDYLLKIKAALVECRPTVEDIDREASSIVKKCKKDQAEQIKRVHDKLKEEWSTVNKSLKERNERWAKCQTVWLGLYTNLDQFGEWMDQADRMVEDIGKEGLPLKDMKQKQKDLEKQVSSKHRQVSSITSVSRDVVSKCSPPLSKDILEQVEILKDRWMKLTNKTNSLRDRITGQEAANLMKEGASTWLQSTHNCLQQVESLLNGSTANPSDDTSLSIRLSLVKAREEELATKRKDMEVLRKSKQLPKNDQINSVQSQMEKASTNLGGHKEYINSKLAALNKYNARLDAVISWVMETKTRINICKDLSPVDQKKTIDAIMVQVRDRETDVNEIFENYTNIEKECESAQQNISAELREKMNKLREDWNYVRTRGSIPARDNRDAAVQREAARKPSLGDVESDASVRKPSASDVYAQVIRRVTPVTNVEPTASARKPSASDAESLPGSRKPSVELAAREKSISDKSLSDESLKSSDKSLSLKVDDGRYRSPESDRDTSLSGVDSRGARWAGAPALSSSRRGSPAATPSAALLASFDKTILQILDWLTIEEEMLRQQCVPVGDVDEILQLIDKQKNVLRELEQKKPQLDELVHTAETLKGADNRQQLHGKVTKLREHWEETNSKVMQRKTQLDAMLGDSQRYDAKRQEADAWLQRMESRLERMAPPAHTADVLESQLREQKSFHAEIHQYKHQIELFSQLTQRLIAVYQQDDTTRIKRLTEQINQRYSNLNTNIINRGKVLHSAMNSLHNFDRSLDKFLAWLSEAESCLETADNEAERAANSGAPQPPHLKDLQSEIETHRDVYASLNGTGRKLLGSLASQEDAVMLQRRLDEMNQRWHHLKSKSMAIRNRLESNAEHWSALLLSLRELIEWVIRKDTELSGFGPPAGECSALLKQQDDHRAFRRQLEDKRPVVESNLLSGRQYIANEPPLSDTSDSEAGRELDGDSRGYRSAEEQARELTRSIRREVNKLSEKWNALIDRSDLWRRKLDESLSVCSPSHLLKTSCKIPFFFTVSNN